MTPQQERIQKLVSWILAVLFLSSSIAFYFLYSKELKSKIAVGQQLTALQQAQSALETQIGSLRSEKTSLEEIVLNLQKNSLTSEAELEKTQKQLEDLKNQLAQSMKQFESLHEEKNNLSQKVVLRAKSMKRTLSKLSKDLAQERARVDLGAIAVSQAKAEPAPLPKPKIVFEAKGKNSVKARVLTINYEYNFVVVETLQKLKLNARESLDILTEDGHVGGAKVEMVDQNLVALTFDRALGSLKEKDLLILTKL